MSYQVDTADYFERQAKPLLKRYKSLKEELKQLIDRLSEQPDMGTPIGKSCYKIRLSIKSKGQGKRGGARVITCVIAVDERVVLLSIYDKADQSTVLDKELERILNEEGLS